MKIAALMIAALMLAWPLRAEAPPPDLRLSHDEVRIDLSDPASLRTILNQSALNDGWEGPFWWRAPAEEEAALAAPLCAPGKRPIAIYGTYPSGGFACAPNAEVMKADPKTLRTYCAFFDRRYAGFPDPVKPFMLVCRKPAI